MTEKWEGFTSEEISNIANQKYSVKESSQSNSPVKKTTFKQNKFGKKNMTRERMLKIHQLDSSENQGKLPQQARLFIPQIPEEEELEDSSGEKPLDKVLSAPVPSEDLNNCETEDNSELRKTSVPNSTATLFTAENEVSLEDFEKRQKMIKEQNRQRKELLKKALEDRTKKTHEEARRLSQIEEELKKLDLQLSNDVSVLRNQIEVASLEFMEAQKRFDRAEKEYLDAKLALFTKKERKELLTGHLCTIIEQNELRKAKKLSDLMDKLQLGSVIVEKSMEKPVIDTDGDSTEDKISSAMPPAEQSPT
uniref:RAB6-interacting golgin n=1 Tax=Graphocephala atropunctata TaxID=36148 RepID=A0A1B6LGX1_9HEMI